MNFNNEPKVTIGMPVYNGEKFLQNALDSLLSQSYKNFVLIISDNASTDSTKKICCDYAKIDKRIHYYRQSENIGIFLNFKFVLNKAETKYFQWAEVDDLWHPTFIEKNVKKLEDNKNFVGSISDVILYSEIKKWKLIVNNKNINHKKHQYVQPILGKYYNRVRTYLQLRQTTSIFGVYRTDILKKIINVNEKYIWDFVLVLKTIKFGEFNVLDEFLMYRYDGGLFTQATSLEYRLSPKLPLNIIIFPHLTFFIWCYKEFGFKTFLQNFFWEIRYLAQGQSQLIIDLIQILKKRL